MKKVTLFCLCGLTALSLMTGCSGSNGEENLGKVTLGEYKGLTVNVPLPEVTDEEVESRVQTALSQNPEKIEVDREAKEGDTVNINYKGTQDGEEFVGGSAENQDLKLGSGRMIDGFEEGIMGMKKGETKDLNLTFPEDYSEAALAGQAVVFEITVNSVTEEKEAVLDDAFVQRISDYNTVDEYKESIRTELMEQEQRNTDYAIQQDVVAQLIANSDFKLSRNGLSKRYNTSLKQYKEQAKMYGMSLSQMAQANGMDEPMFKEYIYASVEDDARNQLVLDAVAAQEGITLTDEDREAFADLNGQTLETVVSMYGQEVVDEMALNYKVMDFLADNAVNEAAGAEAAPEETTEAAPGETESAETKAE